MNFLSSSSVRSLLRASPSLQLHSTSRRLTSQPQLQPAPSLLNVNIKTSDVSAQPPLSVNPNPSPPLYTSAGGIITCKCTLDPKLHPKRPNRILLIRHGESRGNVDENLYATVPDNQMPLSDKGHIQARAAGLQLKSIVGDETVKFYVSPYVRTRQTFMELNKALDPKQWTYREEPRLREQDFGNFQNLEKINRCRQERRLFGAFYYRFPQGESGSDVYDRVSTFIETLHREFQREGCAQNFVLCTHGLTARLFLMRYYHWEVEKFERTWNLENCEFMIMELNPNGRSYTLTTQLKENPKEESPSWSGHFTALS